MNYYRQARNGTGRKNVQKLLTSGQLLTHYNPSLPIHMAMDTSVYRVGAVISHALSNGSERPIAFASHILTDTKPCIGITEVFRLVSMQI